MAEPIVLRAQGSSETFNTPTSIDRSASVISEVRLDPNPPNTKPSQLFSVTLEFIDRVDQELYQEFIAMSLLENWIFYRSIEVIFLILLQITMAFTFLTITNPLWEFYTVFIVYFPLLMITLAVKWARKPLIFNHIQKLLFTYILFCGPVLFLGRAWLMADQFIVFLISPCYITVLYSFCYFLGLRFVYAVAVAILSTAAWFTLAILTWNNQTVLQMLLILRHTKNLTLYGRGSQL